MAAQKMPTLSFLGQSNIVIDFAFGELRQFLARTPTLHNLRGIQLVVEPGPRDAFEFRVDKSALHIVGANSRSCLYGVYALLEELGWRFPAPGEEHFEQTSFRAGAWRHLTGQTVSSFAHRGVSLLTTSNEEAAEVIEWMPRQRLNSIFLGHKGDVAQSRHFAGELQQRGIRLEAGGHILDEFLPLELFETKPDLFRIQDGQRREDGNFCSSNPETLKVITENAIRYVRELPTAEVFHFWAEDVEGGSWCGCDACRDVSPSEQLMRAVNTVADAVAQERPGATVDFILYHDTLEFPDNLQPRPNVFAFYCPRERCYAHGIGESGCAHNAWYASRLAAARKDFQGRISVFEYYCDFILWRCLGLAIPATIHADLPWYKSMGVDDIHALHFGRISNWMYPLNAYVFARSSWDATLKRDALVTEFCHARYGARSRGMLQAYFSIEQASLHALTYDGYGKNAYDLRDTPAEPAEFAEKHIALVDQAVIQIETALSKAPDVDHPIVRRERLLLELTRDNLRALLHQMRGLQHEKNATDPGRGEKMKIEYDAAIALLRDVERRLAADAAGQTGAWSEGAAKQFQMIAELLRGAKEGQRERTW